MLVDISGKVILVTGSSRGIGAKIAYELAREGAYVIINYNKSKLQAEELLERITQFNSNCICVQADITKQEDVKRLKRVIMERYSGIDVLINNAGINSDGLCSMLAYDSWQEVLQTNLTGMFLCTKYFGKVMVKQKRGKIINIASLKGQIGSEGQSNYSASKAGMIGFTKAVAKEYGPFGIAVNAICPGYIKTEMNYTNQKKLEAATTMSVLPISDCLEDLVSFVIYIISDRMNCVSGRVFNIDSRIG